MATKQMISIEDEDKQILINSIKLPNAKYGHALMSVCSKYQVFSEDDIQFLLDQKKCKAAFSSDFAMLRLISDPTQISRIVKDASGYNRYYPEGYEFGGNIYAFTSQLYGYKENGSHRDNRTPFYKWVLGKLRILEEDEEGEKAVPISINEAISQIKKYIASRGFTYNDMLIENFFLSLKSKPFVILAGTSGTGKTRLVKLFAEAIGAEYKLVSVRPDWSDGSDLFGHYDLNGKFVVGPVCDCFSLAYENPDTPVFLCLDEMNLARVEYYLSDFLSVIECREKDSDGKVVTVPIAQYENGIPDNLYIVGTVNMDETTFPFSKKVLDRANTIEFNYVDLIPNFNVSESTSDTLQLPNSFLRTEYLVLNRDCAQEQEYVQEICGELQAINEILVKANAHVGYRVRDEIAFYMLNNKTEGNLLTHNEAFDNEILQKILPRIQGTSASVRDMLCELFKMCASDQNQKTGDTDSEKMRKILGDNTISCRYRKSAEKLELMVRRFEEDGFTSYWL